MKKVLITICLGAIFLTSCGGGNDMQSDAKKMADLTCKMTKAMAADPTKASDFTKEITEFSLETTKKYNTAEDMKAFAEALAKEMENCK
ncbi:hypothetical protein [Olleya sp. Bg11-27]|uniref:hypothetical protein n=1 Tax=Olleya sp. Bg11-27 TaxID=2058135 RepID=UPI000C314A1A|nr:hypothetical protein [Olleya sp. Bg11-27]AUC76182.1 hypothetical protein CW732_11110 [Olleya sp. Bg11-27]